jgi:adenosylcobinamide-GDP ribazoletransferase
MFATGAFHEDGLADTADALGGAIFDRERLMEILKDSRIGTYGTVALVISIGLRAALIAAWGVHGAAAFVLSHVLGRVAPTWLMARMPYVTDPEHAKSRPIVKAQLSQAFVSTLYGAALVLAAWCWLPELGWGPAATFATVPAAAGLCAWRFHKRAGGVTGDFLGATEQICEMTVLLTLALVRP